MKTNKRNLILDAMMDLLKQQKGASCSVSDIAKHAGIAKGGMYYYFRSKEEVFDALVQRTYADIMETCRHLVYETDMAPVEKINSLYVVYRSQIIQSDFDEFLHVNENAAIHQKSLAEILKSMSSLVTEIIRQGNHQGVFHCEYPQEISEIMMSAFCFLLDPGIFTWTPEEMFKKVNAIERILEHELHVSEGTFHFLKNEK